MKIDDQGYLILAPSKTDDVCALSCFTKVLLTWVPASIQECQQSAITSRIFDHHIFLTRIGKNCQTVSCFLTYISGQVLTSNQA